MQWCVARHAQTEALHVCMLIVHFYHVWANIHPNKLGNIWCLSTCCETWWYKIYKKSKHSSFRMMADVAHLATRKATFRTLFAWVPQLKVVMPRVLNVQFAQWWAGQGGDAWVGEMSGLSGRRGPSGGSHLWSHQRWTLGSWGAMLGLFVGNDIRSWQVVAQYRGKRGVQGGDHKSSELLPSHVSRLAHYAHTHAYRDNACMKTHTYNQAYNLQLWHRDIFWVQDIMHNAW
jgi:hypothetical protein